MPDQQAPHDQFSELFGETRKRLIRGVVSGLGGKATDAVRLKPDEELDEWLRPTSPAALNALKAGGTAEQAWEANRLWANRLKDEQAAIRHAGQQQGLTPEQIHEGLKQRGLTDDDIFRACQGQAWELGRANGQDDPKKTAEYHEGILKRIAARRQPSPMRYQTMPGTGGTDADD